MRFIATKEQSWLNQWDEFVFNSLKGSHLVYSDWLKSYQSYGFDFEIGLVINQDDTIMAGYGAVVPKALIFKFYIMPIGPIVDNYSDAVLKTLFDALENRARILKCCAAQISIPYSSHKKIQEYTYRPGFFDSYLTHFKQGKCFDYVYAGYGLNWIDLSGYKDSEDFLKSLPSQTRRNIKISLKLLNTDGAINDNKLKEVYRMIEQNAIIGGYSVRNWNDIKNSLKALNKMDFLHFNIANENNLNKGSSLLFKTKHFMSYIMGGTIKQKPDLKAGYFLHWKAIERSFELNHSGYNISMGGTKGVQEFKSKFGAEKISFENSHYFLTINSFRYKLFILFNSKIKPLKSNISKILRLFK